MAIAKRKKRFFEVEMPIISKTTQLQAYEKKDLQGRLITYDLTRILRGKGILLQLKVQIKENKAIAIPIKAKIMPYFLRRAVRKGTNYIEDSFSTNCKDAQIRIKPFLISRRKVSRAVRKALREKAKEELQEYVKNKKVSILIEEVLKNKIQKPLSLKLKKIYPLALCEIRVLEVEKDLESVEENKETSKEKTKTSKKEDKIEKESNKKEIKKTESKK
jgi:ribosomal protein S3AE